MPTIIDKPAAIISADLLKKLQSFTCENGQVIVHGLIKKLPNPLFIRIWPTTFLFDLDSSHVSDLVYYENISGFPQWTPIQPYSEYYFTLIFQGLPKSCRTFDLIEVIPQNNGFYVPSVARNELDVYYLDFD